MGSLLEWGLPRRHNFRRKRREEQVLIQYLLRRHSIFRASAYIPHVTIIGELMRMECLTHVSVCIDTQGDDNSVCG